MKVNNVVLGAYNSLAVFVILASLSCAFGQVGTYPGIQGLVEPTTRYPLSFSIFTPPVVSNFNVHANAPQIAEWTRQNNPGDTLALTAEGIDGEGVYFALYGEGVLGAGLIQRLDGRQAAVTLPDTLPADDMYLMWPANAYGFGEPVGINQTDLWWIGFDRVKQGDTFNLYGQNLEIGGGQCSLYVKEIDRWLSSSHANPYKAQFVMPGNVASGTYTVYAHNGHGGKYGWSDPLSLTVEMAYTWSANSYDVTNYGANGGDGNADDAAFSSAIAAAKAVNGTVYIPTGTYYFANQVSFNGRIKVVGDGIGKTILTQDPSFSESAFMGTSGQGMIMSNLTVKASNANWGGGAHLIAAWQAKDIIFDAVELSDVDSDNTFESLIRYYENERIRMRNCEFKFKSEVFVKAEGALFENCTFRGGNDCNQMVTLSTSTDLDFSGCIAGNLDDSLGVNDGTGWAKGRWVTGAGPSFYCYFGDNKTSNMIPRLPSWEYKGTASEVINDWGTYNGRNISRVRVPTNGLDAITVRGFPNQSRISVNGGSGFYDINDIDFDTGWVDVLHVGTGNFQTGVDALVGEWVDQNSGEQIMFEGLSVRYRGSPTANSSNTITLADVSKVNDGQSVTIISGKGFGQSRAIESVDGSIVTLEKNWKIIPDTDSVVSVGGYVHHHAVYNNYFDGMPRAATDYTATTGYECYGGGTQVVLDGNVFNELTVGSKNFSAMAFDFDPSFETAPPNYFNVFKNNLATSCYRGFAEIVSGNESLPVLGTEPALMGNIYRNNTASNMVGSMFSVTANRTGDFISNIIFDRNEVLDESEEKYFSSNEVEALQVWIRKVRGVASSFFPFYGTSEDLTRCRIFDDKNGLVKVVDNFDGERAGLTGLTENQWYTMVWDVKDSALNEWVPALTNRFYR